MKIGEAIKQFRDDNGRVGEVWDVREKCIPQERKDVDDLNERISTREIKK